MEKISLKDFKTHITIRLNLLAIPQVFRLLGINKEFTDDQIFVELVKISLNNFEAKVPWVRSQYQYIGNGIGYESIELQSNFDAYLAGTIEESQIKLIPDTIIGFSSTSNLSYTTLAVRDFSYTPPILEIASLTSSQMYLHGVFHRPVNAVFNEGNKLVDGYIYYFSKLLQPEFEYFTLQVLVDLLTYIVNVHENFKYPGLPIEMLQKLPDQISNLTTTLTEGYKKLNRGKYLY